MQLTFALEGTLPGTPRNAARQYSVVVSCNRCGGAHETGISITMENGPGGKQSIGELYEGKSLPRALASLTQASVTCPKTGRQSTQKNHHQIFLVPTKN